MSMNDRGPMAEQHTPAALRPEAYTCTHKEGVKRVAAWIGGTKRMAVVMAERVVVASTETPDAIAWSSGGESILVEVKVSCAEERGVGTQRYFAAPAGMLAAEDLPPGWGLLAIHQQQIREIVRPEIKAANRVAEVAMLVSAIRRLELAATVFVYREDDHAAIAQATKEGP